MPNPIFWEKFEKYMKLSSAEKGLPTMLSIKTKYSGGLEVTKRKCSMFKMIMKRKKERKEKFYFSNFSCVSLGFPYNM